MKRGEMWWAHLPLPVGTRPVLLLSRDEAISVRESVTAAPATTRKRGLKTEVFVNAREGMPKNCVINLDSIGTIEKAVLSQRICLLSPEKMEQVHQAIKFALDLP